MNEMEIQTNRNTIIGFPDYKLFSGGQIVVGTIFGFVIAGQVMLALNSAKLKDADGAKRKLIFALVFLPFILMLPGINAIAAIYLVFSSYSDFKKQQKTAFDELLAQNGERCSNWDAAAICVLSLIASWIIGLIELGIIGLLIQLISQILDILL